MISREQCKRQNAKGKNAERVGGLTGVPANSQNELVRRLMLLAIGLSALVWTAAARPETVPPDGISTMVDAGSCQLTGDPHCPSDSDRQWRAQQQTIAAVTESVWKTALLHAALAATPAPLVFEPSLAASSPDPPVRSALPYLRHTPLLI